MNERDQTCVVPGCDVRDGLEIDHRIIPVVETARPPFGTWRDCVAITTTCDTTPDFRLEGGPGDWQWLPPEKPPPQTTSTNQTMATTIGCSNWSEPARPKAAAGPGDATGLQKDAASVGKTLSQKATRWQIG